MVKSLFPLTVSGNIAPVNRLDDHLGRKSQQVELATWFLHEGEPIEVWAVAKAKRPNRHLKYRLNVEIANPALLAKATSDAVLFATRDALADAAKTGVLECRLVGFADSPEHLLETVEKLVGKMQHDHVYLATFLFPWITLKFAMSSSVEISTKVSPRFRNEAGEMMERLGLQPGETPYEDDEDEENEDFADSDVITLAASHSEEVEVETDADAIEFLESLNDATLDAACEKISAVVGVSPEALRKLLNDVQENPEHYECVAGGVDRDDNHRAEEVDLGESNSRLGCLAQDGNLQLNDGAIVNLFEMVSDGAGQAFDSRSDVRTLPLAGFKTGA